MFSKLLKCQLRDGCEGSRSATRKPEAGSTLLKLVRGEKNMVEFENPANLRQSNVKDPKRGNAFHNLMEGESPAHRLSISGLDVILCDPRHALGS